MPPRTGRSVWSRSDSSHPGSNLSSIPAPLLEVVTDVLTSGASTTIANFAEENSKSRYVANREIDPSELLGAPEIAEPLGLARPQVVRDWRYRRTDFPAWVVELRQVNVWYWPEVQA